MESQIHASESRRRARGERSSTGRSGPFPSPAPPLIPPDGRCWRIRLSEGRSSHRFSGQPSTPPMAASGKGPAGHAGPRSCRVPTTRGRTHASATTIASGDAAWPHSPFPIPSSPFLTTNSLRKSLLGDWPGAGAVTGLAVPERLRARHARAWSERTTGDAVFAPPISQEVKPWLGITEGFRLGSVPRFHEPFLTGHRGRLQANHGTPA